MNPILFICNNDFTCTFLWWWIITLVQNIVSRFKTSNFIQNYKNKQKQNYSHKKPPIPTNPTAKQLNQKFDSFKTNLSSRKNGKKTRALWPTDAWRARLKKTKTDTRLPLCWNRKTKSGSSSTCGNRRRNFWRYHREVP